MSRPLTEKQANVLAFVDLFTKRHKRAPVLREIAEHMHLKSLTTARRHLCELQRKGYLAIAPDKAHGIEVTDPDARARVAIEQAVAVRGRDQRGEQRPALFMPVVRAGEERAA